MSRAPLSFKERDLTRAIRGAVKAGLNVARVEIDKASNRIILFFNGDNEEPPSNDWDKAVSNDRS
jgi:hypothetical protein